MTETQTEHTPDLDIIARAECGCRVVRNRGTVTVRLEFCPLHAATAELLEALREILHDLDSGYIAQPSHRAEVCRRRHEARIRAAIADAEKGNQP